MRLAVAAVIILFVRPLFAAPQWLAMKSSNFELYTSSGEREDRETLVLFEQVRAFFMRVKSENVTTHLPVTIVGFRNPKKYKPYQPNHVAGACYNGDEERDYIVMGTLGGENAPLASHEYMHLLMRHLKLNVPVWLNEGFAEVYSTLKPVGGRIQFGTPPVGRAVTLAQDSGCL